MSNKTKELLNLIKQNPDLPIVPMVNGEICGDDSGYWLGEWGWVSVDEYLLSKTEKVLWKSDDDVWDTLEKYLSDEDFDTLSNDESIAKEKYESLPWTKAIIVYIDTLDWD